MFKKVTELEMVARPTAGAPLPPLLVIVSSRTEGIGRGGCPDGSPMAGRG